MKSFVAPRACVSGAVLYKFMLSFNEQHSPIISCAIYDKASFSAVLSIGMLAGT